MSAIETTVGRGRLELNLRMDALRANGSEPAIELRGRGNREPKPCEDGVRRLGELWDLWGGGMRWQTSWH